ncbi:fungal zn(2)-Cys(6) binuclear cluster domain-containing protein [Sarocladium implicatum]|nr:fungal zn(2)-Cys(6) binuclear cluster domain-containing protein [Sarocladium implicatum]
MAGDPATVYTCATCDKSYRRRTHLLRHEATRADTSKSRFTCEPCQKAFHDVWRKHCLRCPHRTKDEHIPPTTRGRKAQACRQCFQSKVKCDQSDPCRRCRSRQLQCRFPRQQPRTEDGLRSSQVADRGNEARTGAMFLLSLTNPAATTMLETFEDENVHDAETRRLDTRIENHPFTIDDHEASLGMGSFLFDLLSDEVSYSQVDSASEDYSVDPNVPIFRPEALPVLQRKSASAIQHLHDLSKSVVADSGQALPYDAAAVEQALSPESLLRFTAMFFQVSHRYIPLAYRPSFGLESTSTCLLLAVALAGALRCAPRDDAMTIRSIRHLVEEYTYRRLGRILSECNNPHASPRRFEILEILQAATLLSNIRLMVTRVNYRLAPSNTGLPVLVSTLQRHEFLSMQRTHGATGSQYVYEEGFAQAVATCDWHQSIMFRMIPLISVSEMTCTLPDWSDYLDSKAKSPDRCSDWHRRGTQSKGPRSICDWICILQEERAQASDLATIRQISMQDMSCIILGIADSPCIAAAELTGLGLTTTIISCDLICTLSSSLSSLQRALTRWEDAWSVSFRDAGARVLEKSGIERHSDGHCWAAWKILEALRSEPKRRHCYFQNVGHDTLKELHSFLTEAQSAR